MERDTDPDKKDSTSVLWQKEFSYSIEKEWGIESFH